MTKKLIVLALAVPLLAACDTTPERPIAFKHTYETVSGMTDEQFAEARKQEGQTDLAKRFMWVDEQKFRNGDSVEYKIGTLTVMAKYIPLLRVGHFTFVNDPKGVEGEISTSTFIVSATEDGLVARNEETGKMTIITKDIGRTPDVARLIISKAGDILAALGQNAWAAEIKADAACTENCGGGGATAAAFSFSDALSSGSVVIRDGF